MNVGHVQGGTHAGWRRVREAHKPWLCGCFILEGDPFHETAVKKLNPGYRAACTDCDHRRPS